MSNQRRNLAIQIQTPGGDNPLLVSLVSAGPYYRGVAVSGLALVGKGGTAPYAYSIIATSSNDLPPGLSVDPLSGQITGTPSLAGHFSFIAQVSDSASATFTHSFSITILAQLFWRGPPPPKGEIDVSYNYQFRVFDAAGTLLTSGFTYDGTLPAGLTLSTGGLLSGTPTAPAGISYATVHATDGTDTLDIPIAIEVAELLSISSFPPGTVIVIGQPFSFGVTRTGGVDPVRYRIDPDFAAFWPDFAVINPNTGVVTGVTNDLALAGGFPGLKVLAEDALGATSSNGGFVDIVAQIIKLQAGANVSIDYTDKQNPIIGANPGAGGGIATIAGVGPDSSGNLEIEGIEQDSSGQLHVVGGDVMLPIGISDGGTGQTTAQAAFDALAPSSPTKGDILVYNGTHWVKHTHGSNGQIMQFDSTQSDGIANITSAFVPFRTLAAEILADSPMAFWKLDETSGSTFVDSSGNGYDLTIGSGGGIILAQSAIVPTLPSTAFPYFGNSTASRSGTLGFTTPITGAWTVEFIIAYGSPGVAIAPIAIANNGETAADNIQIQIDIPLASFITVEWETGSGSNVTRNLRYAVPLYSPSIHVMVVKTGSAGSGGNFLLYINGAQRRTANAVSVSSDPTGGSAADTYIGSYVTGSTLPTDSFLAYMAVYGSALSASRAAAHAQAGGLFQ